MNEDSLVGSIHDLARAAIAAALRLAGLAAALRHRIRLLSLPARERGLRWRYGITPATPLTRELPGFAAPAGRAESGGSGPPVALTSGTSGDPKRVRYPRARLRAVRGVFVDAMLRLIAAQRIRRPSLYVFGPLAPDGSLSRLLTEEARPPSRLALLQAPYRAQSDPALRRLGERYGAVALRLVVLAVSNPGILYATNPSTLSTFFEELEQDWERATALAGAIHRNPESLDPAAFRALRRLRSRGDSARLARLAKSAEPLPTTVWAPAATHHVCWTGGSVAPFLERLDKRLPPPRFRRVPMFSMSTETIETIPDYRDRETAFLAAAPGVLHEFLDPDASDPYPRLLPPRALRPGQICEMVVSHRFGLRRYATGDLFRVERLVGGHPDLRFLRRRGLGWSFTGEKLTAEQVTSALEALDTEQPGLRARVWLTLFPSTPGGGARPCYRLVAVGRLSGGAGLRDLPADRLTGRLDALLSERNLEYRAKRESRRLGGIRFSRCDLPEFVRRASGGGSASPDSQFKYQVFCPRRWEQD